MRLPNIEQRLRTYLHEHPGGGTVAALTRAISAKYEGNVETALHALLHDNTVTRFIAEVVDFARVYHYRLPTDRLILALAGA